MDGLRAMREARYAENAARAKTAPKTPAPKAAAPATAPAAKKAAVRKAAAKAAPAVSDATDTALCGHRNMSGRSCTREHGHAAKSHRYS